MNELEKEHTRLTEQLYLDFADYIIDYENYEISANKIIELKGRVEKLETQIVELKGGK